MAVKTKQTNATATTIQWTQSAILSYSVSATSFFFLKMSPLRKSITSVIEGNLSGARGDITSPWFIKLMTTNDLTTWTGLQVQSLDENISFEVAIGKGQMGNAHHQKRITCQRMNAGAVGMRRKPKISGACGW